MRGHTRARTLRWEELRRAEEAMALQALLTDEQVCAAFLQQEADRAEQEAVNRFLENHPHGPRA